MICWIPKRFMNASGSAGSGAEIMTRRLWVRSSGDSGLASRNPTIELSRNPTVAPRSLAVAQYVLIAGTLRTAMALPVRNEPAAMHSAEPWNNGRSIKKTSFSSRPISSVAQVPRAAN
jgi:hypothetical protein